VSRALRRRRVAGPIGGVLAAAVVAVVVVATPAGAPASAADDAAIVNGIAISVEDFDDLVTSVAESGQFQLDPASGVIEAGQGRSALQILITNEAQRQFLDEQRVAAISDGERESAGQDLDEQSGGSLTGAARDALVDQTVLTSKLVEVAAPDVATLADSYAVRPASLGVVCGRIIVVDDVGAGEDAIDSLDAGGSFADVGEEYSTEPDFAGTGGSLTGDPEQPCVPLSGVQGAGVELAGALVAARPGQPAGPIETGAGIIVFVADPFDDVAGAITDLYESPGAGAGAAGGSAGQLMFAGWLLDADISVNPRYGRWDPATATIVALGQE